MTKAKNHIWTEDEEDLLRKRYRNNKESLDELCQIIGVGEGSLRSKLGRLGLLKQTIWWTDKEMRYLEKNYQAMSIVTMSSKLGRSLGSVTSKVHHMKVCKTVRDGWFTQNEVAKILGVDAGWIKRRIGHGYVLDRELFHEEGKKIVWRISEKSLRDFIRTYPEELIGHNVDFVMIVDILAGIKPVRE